MPLDNNLALSSYNFIDLIGTGVSQFLKGQLTINAELLDSKTAKLAAFCNHKGRIVSLFHIAKIENGFRLVLPSSITEPTIAHIKKYSVFFDVEISCDPERNVYFSLIENSVNEAAELPQSSLLIDRTKLLFTTSNETTSTSGILPYWQMAENNIPWLTEQTVEQFLPHSLNLPALEAVDFKKGCFTGQEVIARMHYKGKLKQQLTRLSSPLLIDLPPLNKLIQADKSVGEVICSVNQPDKGCLVLALVKNTADKTKEFQLKIENTPILELTVKD